MEESNEELRVIPELYFLIAKFLSGGPLKETAKTLLNELERVEVLPRRLDWLGGEHAQSYDELASRYAEVGWTRLAAVCARALQLAPGGSPGGSEPGGTEAATGLRLAARLSLLSESLVRATPKYSTHKPDHTLVRRLLRRELGTGAGSQAHAGSPGAPGPFPARMLAGLQLQRRTLGHLSAVYCLVFDCTGRYVVTGADDLLVKVWSALDGRLVGTLRGAGAEITDVCVSRDGALLACGSVERLVRVWCLATGAPRAVLAAHAGTITSVHWAPPQRQDVRWLASTSTDGSVAFWTCSPDGQFLSQPVQYVERMRPGACHMICAAWSAGGGFLAAGSADHHVRLYAVHPPAGAGGPPRRVLEVAVHGDAVDSLAWAHRGLRFLSGSKDGSAALWTLHATQWRHQLLRCSPTAQHAAEPKRLKVTMVCWDCSDAYVITAVSDNTVRVWCSRTCQQVRELRGHRDEAYVLEAHPFLSAVFLSAGHDGQLFVWDAAAGEVLARFHNHIDGQGDGAIFDAKWGGGAHVAASDSHGHLLLLGLGQGDRLLRQLPTELFFHTDYRPLVRDALGGALDEQTETPPHLMPPPFLVDVEGAPHAPAFQRLVPGRENLTLSQLIPAAEAARSRLDLMIEALAAERTPPAALAGLGGEGRGVWRGEGVRHTAGSWQSGEPMPHSTRPVVAPLSAAARERIERASAELNALEQSWYRREMRRRPLMISTATDGGPRRKPGRRPARAQPRPSAVPQSQAVRVVRACPSPEAAGEAESGWSDASEESARVSEESRVTARYARSPRASSGTSDTSLSYSDSRSDASSDSSQYSDWEAGAALAPPARSRRRPLPTTRYSPSAAPSKRGERGAAHPAPPAAACSPAPSSPGPAPAPAPAELPEAFRPGEWLCAVSPRKAPYHPQMGDHCLYFRLGHQRYFEAVAEKDLYKLNPRDKPWERTQVYECEAVKVVGIKYVIKPPRVVCLRLACGSEAPRARTFTVRYHDMPDVIDFLVLRQQYEAATARRWGHGDRFRCMIDDSWWTGVVLEAGGGGGAGSTVAEGEAGEAWAREAAAHFLSLRVRWDNGEVERLSPWDLEPFDPERLPSEPGGAVPVLPHELEAVLYRAEASEWPPRGDRAAACRAIAHHISQVMSLSVAEPFVAPVDLQLYPSYALVVPYPIDLATIKARFENLFYRRTAAAQFDVRYLASNAEQFNEPHSPIVRQARLVTDLLLHIISHWREVDVVAKYHELAAAYHSSDDEPLAAAYHSKSGRARRGGGARGRGGGESAAGAGGEWRAACSAVLRELLASGDAEPFRRPVSAEQAPDYPALVSCPMDLGTVEARLTSADAGVRYARADQFARDVRLVFANSRLYNTNKRSRIYSMTVRLSALFESLWTRMAVPAGGRAGTARHARRPRRALRHPRRATRTKRTERADANAAADGCSGSSESETLAATSRRVHGGEVGGRARGGRGRADSWDSDAPLNAHRKGKGVGKKSKSGSTSAEPAAATLPPAPCRPGPSRATQGASPAPAPWSREGGADSSESAAGDDAYCNIEVLEEELVEEDVELTYHEATPPRTTPPPHPPTHPHTRHHSVRKRRRARSSDSSAEWEQARRARRKRRVHNTPKRTRERFTEGTSTSESSSEAEDAGRGGSGAGGGGALRYESDHSYKPRYSTDDDAPLNVYRRRHEGDAGADEAGGGEEGAGPSGARRAHNGHARSGGGGVSLRARHSPRRYNEDSEEDSIAAISKRLPHHHHHHHQQAHTQRRRQRHAAHQGVAGAASTTGAHVDTGAPRNHDHNYFNGHHHAHNHHQQDAGGGGGGGPSATGADPVSISSRGRVRKLTAKARGLLRD